MSARAKRGKASALGAAVSFFLRKKVFHPKPGNPGVVAQGSHLPFLRFQLLAGALLIAECVIHLSKCILDCLLVTEERLLLDGLCGLVITRDGAACENRADKVARPVPGLAGT